MKSVRRLSIGIVATWVVLGGILGAQVPLPDKVSVDALNTVSGPVYIPTALRVFGFDPGREHLGEPSEGEPFIEEEGGEEVALATTPLYTNEVNNDLEADVEASIISALDSGATSVGYIKRLPGDIFRNYVGFTTDFFSWANTQLPLPFGYSHSADPLQHANVFNDGIAPRRTYLTGIIYNGASNITPNAIGVWRSDNGGSTWSNPTLVAVNSSSTFFLDKPDVEVAWWSGTRGRVYVAYVRFHNTQPQTQNAIFVARSDDGGVSFNAPVQVAQGFFQGPQMLASTVGSRIYVIWSDYNAANERLLMAWSDNQGATWTAPETVATGNLLTGADPLTGNVRALTLPMARYNGVRNAIAVVWHELAADGRTDIYFATKTATGWSAKKRINPVTANDQFMPALDYDPSGNYLVTYYDRSGDPNNLRYREKWVKIDHLGNILESGEVANGFESDPTLFPARFVGDYQDVWWWSFADMLGDRFNAAWAGRPVDRVNPYVSGIQ